MTNWEDEIKTINSGLERFRALNVYQLNLKPEPGKWSIAQQFDHLITINSTYFPIFDEIRAGTYKLPWQGRVAFIYNLLGKLILKSVEPGNSRKTKTFPIWEPSKSEIPGDILDRFLEHQNKLSELMVSCKDLIEKGQVISSPANKNIVYTVEIAFRVILTHERRHIMAAERILGSNDMK